MHMNHQILIFQMIFMLTTHVFSIFVSRVSNLFILTDDVFKTNTCCKFDSFGISKGLQESKLHYSSFKVKKEMPASPHTS